MGTPPCAVASLNVLFNNSISCLPSSNYSIAAVVTQPPAPGKRHQIVVSPVQEFAQKHNLLVLHPDNCKDNQFLEEIKSISPDLCITAAYGNYLPKAFLAIPPLGTLNIHPSLLPKYRGAAPIQRCLENGDNETGVSVLYSVQKMDAGPIIFQSTRKLEGSEKSTALLLEFFEQGAMELVNLLPKVFDGTIQKQNQDETQITHAPKISTEEGHVDVSQFTATEIHNKVRAFSEWPGVWLDLYMTSKSLNKDKEKHSIKIITTKVINDSNTEDEKHDEDHVVRFIKKGKDQYLRIKCRDGTVLGIVELQPPTKKIMNALSFSNGLHDTTLTTH